MRTGTTIAHYRIGDRIGRGGMGEVFRATDTRLDRTVALKFLDARYVADDVAKERFIREAKSASALDHPNICTIHDIGETDDGELYIVMAFYEGPPLDKRLTSETFEVARTEHIVRQLGDALKRAHDGGIVHRDVKPANIMVSGDDAVRLLDFGVAKLHASEALTQTGVSLGTAEYMSPEQAAGDPVTTASDVWAIGMIAYEMLAGQRPFRADNPLATIHRIVTTEPAPLREVAPDVPEALATVVHRALAKDPVERYQDGAGFLAAWNEATGYAGGVGATAGRPPSTRPQSFGTHGAWIGVGVAAVALVAAVVFLPGSGSDDTPPTDPDLVAVFPFEVAAPGVDYDYLHEAMAELVGDRLDGAGPLRTVDPRAVVGRLREHPAQVVDPEVARELAGGLGAGRFVLGSVLVVPGTMTLAARFYETDPDAAEPDQVRQEGLPDSLHAMTDRLATSLLEASLVGANARIQRSAARSSTSPEATKAFLRGEQFHRYGEYDSAAAAYNRAIALDSTFALAHLMKSMNNAYTYETDDYEAAATAVRHAGDLPERDRLLIEAFHDMQAGRLDDAEAQLLQHLKRWPDEVKALLYLGILYQRSNPRWARPAEEARTHLEAVLALEPANVVALHRLSRLDAGSGRLDRLAARAARLREVAPDSEWEIDARLMAAILLDRTDEIEALIETFTEQSLVVRLYAAYNALRFSEDLELAERMIEQTRGALSSDTGLPEWLEVSDDLSIVIERLVALNGGRFGELREALTDPDRPASAAWRVWDAELVVADVFDVDDDILNGVLERLMEVDPNDRLQNPFEPLHDIFTPEVARLERDVSVAKLLARLGRMDEAWAVQQRIAESDPFEAFHSLHEDAALGLAADLHYLEGDRERALEVLRSIRYQVPMTATSISVTTGSHARFLRAELEFEIGDHDAAMHLYAGIVEGFSPPDKLFMSVAYERLGRLHEEAGRLDRAREYHGRFVRVWQDADAEVAARRDAAAARLEALGAG